MKKIILFILSCFVFSATLYGQQYVMYNLVQNGTSVEVYANPHNSPTSTTALVLSGNTVVIKSQLGSGGAGSISVTDVAGNWSVGTLGQADGLDYTIISFQTLSLTIDPFVNGTPILLFTFTITCNDGEVALMDNINDPVPPTGSNWGNSFNGFIPGGTSGELYNGNELNHEISCLGGLPVDLISFTGKKVQDGNLLEWRTASEENNEGFELQKSEDGAIWKTIGWVEGKGTTSELNSYEYLDREPLPGDNYYRLKQIDYDGKFELSNIINLKNADSDKVTLDVTPNPSSGIFTATVYNPKKEKLKITLFGSEGRKLWESELIEDMELWKKEFYLVQKEMYFISVQKGDEIITEKILIIDRA